MRWSRFCANFLSNSFNRKGFTMDDPQKLNPTAAADRSGATGQYSRRRQVKLLGNSFMSSTTTSFRFSPPQSGWQFDTEARRPQVINSYTIDFVGRAAIASRQGLG